MNDKLQEYFDKCNRKESVHQEQIAIKVANRRNRLLMSLGLTDEMSEEVSYLDSFDVKTRVDGRTRYLKISKVPISVSEDEFEQILATLPPAVVEQYNEDIRDIERNEYELTIETEEEAEKKISSFPETFFYVTAVLSWLIGVCATLPAVASRSFSGLTLAIVVGSVVCGFLSMCASYVCAYLADICENVRMIKRRMK